MKKFLTMLLGVLLSLSTIFCFVGCDLTGESDKVGESFNAADYNGTYYFQSKTVLDKTTNETTVYEVGEDGYTKEYMTLEIDGDLYELKSQEAILAGNWSYNDAAGVKNPFDFYANGVLGFSASIKDGVFTRKIREYNVEITIVLVKE